jgi:hypothetical protein
MGQKGLAGFFVLFRAVTLFSQDFCPHWDSLVKSVRREIYVDS